MIKTRKKILAVDDEKSVLSCLGTLLKAMGYDFQGTTDPREASGILSREDVQLVALDVHMPGLTGFDLYRQLRQIKNIPILFITGFSESFDMSQMQVSEMWQQDFLDGTTDILYKPFDTQTLRDKVGGLIGPPQDEEE